MKPRSGITVRLLIWQLVIIVIFSVTIMILFLYIHQVRKSSDRIVNKRYTLSSISRRMLDNLFTMEENERKYKLLKKEEYKTYYVSAKEEYEKHLIEVLHGKWTVGGDGLWYPLYESYRAQDSFEDEAPQGDAPAGMRWIPESVRNDWVQAISKAKLENELAAEREMRDLHRMGLRAVHWGIVGVVASTIMALLGIVFLTRSINRPLRHLQLGIRGLSREGAAKPIPIHSRDEFGELARAFNEMAMRLKEEERMRSDFISMLSHEIRTPLTSIRESVNLISEGVTGEITPRQRRLLEIAREEIERLTVLLNHLMQVARMEAGVLEIQARPTDAGSLVESTLHRLAPLAEAKGIGMSAHIADGTPQAMADPDHLQQVILNLVGNAIKFSPPQGHVVLTVEKSQDSAKLVFSVADAGPGIPEEEKQMVFHKYYRIGGAKHQVDGVGLGLSISKYIVEAHGGEIWVDSRLGGGSILSFSIPVSPEG